MSVKIKLVKLCVVFASFAACVGSTGCGPAYPVPEPIPTKGGDKPAPLVTETPAPAPVPPAPGPHPDSEGVPKPTPIIIQPTLKPSPDDREKVPEPAPKQKSELLNLSLVKQSGAYQGSLSYGLFDESKVNFADTVRMRTHRFGNDIALDHPIQLELQDSGLYRDVLLVIQDRFGEQKIDEIRVLVETRHTDNSDSSHPTPSVARSDRRNGRYIVSFLEAMRARDMSAFRSISKTENQTFKLELLFTDRTTETLSLKFRLGGSER